MKLWINEREFIELDDRKSLAEEIAPRSRSVDWMGVFGLLPDPDPVLRKLGQDVTVYRQLLSDAHVWSCYQSRKSGTLSCEWEIREPAAGSVRLNRRAHQTIQDVMTGMNVYQTITDMLEAPFFGMSPMEVMWNSKNGWLPERVVGKPPEWFAFDEDNRPRFKSKDNMIDGEELPEYKFLLPTHHASYQNPYGERILSRCFWPAVFKKGGFKFWAIFTEKYGMPWITAKVPRGTNDTERAALLGNLNNMVQDAVAVINDDEKVEITEASGKRASADIYEKLISVSNSEISKAILGQTATTEGTPGKLGNEDAQQQVRTDLVDQDKQMVKAAFNQLFGWIMDLNFPGTPAPVFAFYEEEAIQRERAERDKVLADIGLPISKKYFYSTYDIPVPEEGEEILGAELGKLFEYHLKYGLVMDNEVRKRLGLPPITGGDKRVQLPPGQGQAGQFAEKVKKNSELDRALKAQDSLDKLADAARDKAVPIFDKHVATITQYLDGVKSLKEAKDGIIDLYNELDVKPLTELLAGNLQKSDRIGVESITRSAEFAEGAFWGPALPFEEAIDYFNARAFTISGITNAEILADIQEEIAGAMKAGTSIAEFRTGLKTYFENLGYDSLHPYRIDTIFRTNMQGAYQAGRYRQMTSPAVLAARPYWRLVAVLDGSTRSDHGAMHGKIYPAGHSLWDTWYPPNGFNCRCTVVTVSAREMEQEGWKVETKDSARLLAPDSGWAHNPATEIWTPDLKKYGPKLRVLLTAAVGETLEKLKRAA